MSFFTRLQRNSSARTLKLSLCWRGARPSRLERRPSRRRRRPMASLQRDAAGRRPVRNSASLTCKCPVTRRAPAARLPLWANRRIMINKKKKPESENGHVNKNIFPFFFSTQRILHLERVSSATSDAPSRSPERNASFFFLIFDQKTNNYTTPDIYGALYNRTFFFT